MGAVHGRGMYGRGHAWQGVYVVEGMHGRGVHGGGMCGSGGGMCGDGGSMCGGMHGRGLCMVVESMHGRGCAWQQGTCVAGGACVQERWPLKQAVRILLECILVDQYFKVSPELNVL